MEGGADKGFAPQIVIIQPVQPAARFDLIGFKGKAVGHRHVDPSVPVHIGAEHRAGAPGFCTRTAGLVDGAVGGRFAVIPDQIGDIAAGGGQTVDIQSHLPVVRLAELHIGHRTHFQTHGHLIEHPVLILPELKDPGAVKAGNAVPDGKGHLLCAVSVDIVDHHIGVLHIQQNPHALLCKIINRHAVRAALIKTPAHGEAVAVFLQLRIINGPQGGAVALRHADAHIALPFLPEGVDLIGAAFGAEKGQCLVGAVAVQIHQLHRLSAGAGFGHGIGCAGLQNLVELLLQLHILGRHFGQQKKAVAKLQATASQTEQ